jgi:exodeoxyribonuclease V alpha subunit
MTLFSFSQLESQASAATQWTDVFSPLNRYFGVFICRLADDPDPDLFLAAALASRATDRGDICLDLVSVAAELVREQSSPLNFPDLKTWVDKLRTSPVVGLPGQRRPLILDHRSRLYLFRYWEYENQLAGAIQNRIQADCEVSDPDAYQRAFERMFPRIAGDQVDWQAVAAGVATLKRFCVITGGPGTGKTFTVAKILTLLLEQDPHGDLRILLATPTGKAAARLKQSIRESMVRLDCSEAIKKRIPTEVYTIHRLLKSIPNSPYFHHDSDNPLPAEVVVVDEASMVDLALMSKLVQATPPAARLILLGDRNQLASVEPGAVLGDICDRSRPHGYSHTLVEKIHALTTINLSSAGDDRQPLRDSIVELSKSYRFAPEGGIGQLSRAVTTGNRNGMWQALAGSNPEIEWHEIRSPDTFARQLTDQIIQGYRPYLGEKDPINALAQFSGFKILCALNHGPFGITALNKLAEEVLRREKLLARTTNPWYVGKPVLIRRNDYHIGLFNGDIGITLPSADFEDETLFVYFPNDSGGVRGFPFQRLPEHDTAFAMTVHKSQGSEFEEVLLILPDKDYPILTRELIYTALTRATRTVSIWGTKSVLDAAIDRQIERASGLRDVLWR